MLVENEMDLDEAIEIICYPRYSEHRTECLERINILMNLGVVKIYSFGDSLLGRFRVVGKGHASIVVLARHRIYGDVAVKIRRFDSKRTSLETEGEFLRKAAVTGYTPVVYEYTRDFIVREFIEGPKLIDFLTMNIGSREVIKKVIRALIHSSYNLDNIFIEIQEISRPDKQIIVRRNDPEKIYYIDLESARISNKSSNLTKIINYILRRDIKGVRIKDLLNIDPGEESILRDLARIYKKDLVNRKYILDKILEIMNL